MVNLMAKRKYFFILSLVLIAIGLAAMLINGIKLDIQFQGGTQIMIQMNDNDFDLNKASKIAEDISGKIVSAKKLMTRIADSADKASFLMLQIGTKESLNNAMVAEIINTIRTEFNVNKDNTYETQNIDPLIGAELLRNGILAMLVSSALIILYMWVRFSILGGLSAAVFALIALVHDFLIMFGMYTVFRIPLNDSFIAAVLTILGYSLNDTIIIYDRIRENTKLFRKNDIEELVNRSVMQTMSRSINTVLTTVLAIVCVYILAAINHISSLTYFAFPLIVGLISGAYSSIFIAAPLYMMYQKAIKRRKVKA
jgi:preprotein translocase subunit SecF